MNPAIEKALQLPNSWHGRPSPEQLAQALKVQLSTSGLKPGELLPATKDYAVANRLRNNLMVKAFEVLKAEGLIRLNRQRRHILITNMRKTKTAFKRMPSC